MFRMKSALTLALLFLAAFADRAAAQDPARVRDIVYGRKTGMALTMDVLKPAKPNSIGVLFMVSGGWNSNIDSIGTGLLKLEFFKPFTDRGQTVFLVCHGSQPKFTVGEINGDIQRAIRFIRTHAREYGVDPERLGITGASSGGYLSLMAGVAGKPGDPNAKDPVDKAPGKVAAVACFFPPTDLVNFGKSDSTVLEFPAVKFVQPAFALNDKPRDEQLKALRQLSPIYAVTKESAPTFIITGDSDILVPHEQSERFIAKLKENNVPAELDIRKGANHGWANMDKDAVLFAEWFAKHCGPK